MALEWAGPALLSLVFIAGIFAYVSTKLAEENGWLKFLFLFVSLSYLILAAYGGASVVGEAASGGANVTTSLNTTNTYANFTQVEVTHACSVGDYYPNNDSCSGVSAVLSSVYTIKTVPELSTSALVQTQTTGGSTSATGFVAILQTAGQVLLFVILILAAYIAVKLLTGVKEPLKEAGDRLVNNVGQ